MVPRSRPRLVCLRLLGGSCRQSPPLLLPVQEAPLHPGAPGTTRHRAFVVGIDTGGRAVSDVLAAVVGKLQGAERAVSVDSLLENPTLETFRSEFIQFLGGLSPGCGAVLYFCGLAYGDDRGIGYLVPAGRSASEGESKSSALCAYLIRLACSSCWCGWLLLGCCRLWLSHPVGGTCEGHARAGGVGTSVLWQCQRVS
jgi:hypothetical protein